MKKQRQHFADKSLYNQSYGFSNSHVQMWDLDHKEGWAPKNWCIQIVVLEKALESSLDYKEIKPINPKGNQSWIFIGKTEAEAPVLWPPDAKSWLIGIALHAGKDLRQKWAADDEMVRWYHQLNGHEFEQTLGDSGGQRILECDNLWNHKESDQTRLSDWTTSPPSDYELL